MPIDAHLFGLRSKYRIHLYVVRIRWVYTNASLRIKLSALFIAYRNYDLISPSLLRIPCSIKVSGSLFKKLKDRIEFFK